MREISNNMEVGKTQKADVKFSGHEKFDVPQETESTESAKEIKDFSNSPAEVLGRSQVSSTDNLKNDVAFGMANPQAIETSDKYFNMKYNQLLAQGHPHAYEEAASQAAAFGREFN